MTSRMPHTPVAMRVLGLLGMLGGLVLLAAFVVDVPPESNTVRLILFLGGGVAVALTTPERRGVVSRRLAWAAVIPIIVASAATGGWLLVAAGRDRPFAGDFGLLGFWITLAMWLSHAWFGIVAARMDIRWRPAALLLAVAAILAITGHGPPGTHVAGAPDDLRADRAGRGRARRVRLGPPRPRCRAGRPGPASSGDPRERGRGSDPGTRRLDPVSAGSHARPGPRP